MIDEATAVENLLRARAEIEATIKRYDLAAVIVLHSAPNCGEVLVELSPSYSIVKINEEGRARIRSKLVDYNGDEDAQRADMEASANMASMLFELVGKNALALGDLSGIIDKAFGAEHTNLSKVDRH
jgi:hypothetical protein